MLTQFQQIYKVLDQLIPKYKLLFRTGQLPFNLYSLRINFDGKLKRCNGIMNINNTDGTNTRLQLYC